MSKLQPSFLMWMKRKITDARGDLKNLATSGVATKFANDWQSEVLTKRAAEIVARSGEANQFGLPSLKQAIRAAWEIPGDRELVASLGASGGYRLVCEMLLAARTDVEVVIESPVYEPLRVIPERLGAKLVFAARQGGVDEVLNRASKNTVAVILSNLHNPTGDWMPHEDVVAIAERLQAISRQAVVVVDETFLDLGPRPGTSAVGLHPRVVVTSSLSKCHGLPALRCGWVAADVSALPNFVEDAVLFQNIGGKVAEILGAIAIEEIEAFRRAGREHVEVNRALVANWLREMAEGEVIEPLDVPAGCVVFPRVVGCQSSAALVDALESRFGVLVAPGYFFGEAFDGHIRIGFGGDRENLRRGLERLADGLGTLSCSIQ